MHFSQQLVEHIQAAFSGLWIQSPETDEVERQLRALAQEHHWQLAAWDLSQGFLSLSESAEGLSAGPAAPDRISDPLSALQHFLERPTTADFTAELLVLPNFHRFLQNPEIIQQLIRGLRLGKQLRKFLVILAPVVQLPPELQRQFVVLEFPLPQADELGEIARELVADAPSLIPTGPTWQQLLDAAAGLTRSEAENAFSLSLVRHGTFQPDVIWELKSQTLRQQSLLRLHRGRESFAALGGLQALKQFCRQALRPQSGTQRVTARGILLLSPPGCGKSAFCRALGQETGRPVLTLDLGAVLGGIVGETERNIRQALQVVDAMAPCVLFVDELEKGLSGVGGTGDAGVATRLFGTLLTWLSDHTSDVFFVGTANSIQQLPPEFTRAERLDGVFFVDLPAPPQRQEIWSLYRQEYDIAASEPIPADTGWTGAEIKSCCRLSALLGISLTDAARQVVPVSRTSAEAIEHLRQWASGRCLSADVPGLFTHTSNSTSRRKVTPSTN
ncbi:AAA ATPase central domain protein [Planctopirus limnophila DSM 3776]|uniref:Uncharacterized AAA domain-containing protein ycf46 n=1 Tax=Planctopirus limnophila (strain ATCC 43296 / DSM 3776 / IFAM 1008 / Mu 290) TaxID=521674 RepID=D5STU2_PLAL2|nr:AAA family ATPase [Planctopirus limnophila]ADG66927.1 AAA ATPase central domain protein [Planctopirus limnophila DSM 3776]